VLARISFWLLMAWECAQVRAFLVVADMDGGPNFGPVEEGFGVCIFKSDASMGGRVGGDVVMGVNGNPGFSSGNVDVEAQGEGNGDTSVFREGPVVQDFFFDGPAARGRVFVFAGRAWKFVDFLFSFLGCEGLF